MWKYDKNGGNFELKKRYKVLILILANCGGIINIAGGQTYVLTSPNYPSNYDTGLECVWLIQVSIINNKLLIKIITVVFKKFKVL